MIGTSASTSIEVTWQTHERNVTASSVGTIESGLDDDRYGYEIQEAPSREEVRESTTWPQVCSIGDRFTKRPFGDITSKLNRCRYQKA